MLSVLTLMTVEGLPNVGSARQNPHPMIPSTLSPSTPSLFTWLPLGPKVPWVPRAQGIRAQRHLRDTGHGPRPSATALGHGHRSLPRAVCNGHSQRAMAIGTLPRCHCQGRSSRAMIKGHDGPWSRAMSSGNGRRVTAKSHGKGPRPRAMAMSQGHDRGPLPRPCPWLWPRPWTRL